MIKIKILSKAMYLIWGKFIGEYLSFSGEYICIIIHYEILVGVTYNKLNKYAYVGISKVRNMDHGDDRTLLVDRIYIYLFIFIYLRHIRNNSPIQ